MKDAHRWIDLIIEKLFENDRSKIVDQVIELTQNNNVKNSCNYIGFRHMGKTFLSQGHNHKVKGKQAIIPSLAFELAPIGNKIVQQTNNLDRDEKEIRQILFKVLDHCMSIQDIRDSLPEPVVQLFPQLSAMTRRATVAYWMDKDKLTVNEFNRLLPKIEAYAISKLFY